MEAAGDRFGRLVLVERVAGTHSVPPAWVCRCDCGRVVTVRVSTLRHKRPARSCGCLRRDTTRERSASHGHAKQKARRETPEYRSWEAAKGRCFNPQDDNWDDYGGRGITMCDRWKNSFAAFLEDMGRRPPGTSIDRIENDGHYEPGNCRWATAREQRANQRKRR